MRLFRRLALLLLPVLLSVALPLGAAGREYGVYSTYDFEAPRVNVAPPKGYTPCYISHYGRHGSRYINREYEYDALVKVLDHASLTPEGRRIRMRFDEIYPALKGRATDLSPVGRAQQRRLGMRMRRDWPAVFRKDCRVRAVASDIPRAILSMYSFLGGLQEKDVVADLEADVPSPLVPVLKNHARYKIDVDSALLSRFDIDALYRRLFTDPEAARGLENPILFTRSLYYFGCHLKGVGIEDQVMERAFTDAEAATLAALDDEKFSYHCGWGDRRNVARVWTVLDDFVRRADEELASEKPCVRLRFGHDNTLIPLMAMLELGPFDATVFSSSEVPMASNVRWIFARNKTGHVLVKVQYNESDVMPWRDWKDFREECLGRIAWAQRCELHPPRSHSAADANTPAHPLFSGHRGLQPFGPENSVASFEAAVREGMWAIETDFRMTADGVVICMHDATLDRTTDGTGKVLDHRMDEIRSLQVREVNTKAAVPARRYDYGSLTRRQKSIPTMDDYFRACRRGGCVAFVELKEDNGIIAQMNRAIEKYGLQGRVVISSGQIGLLRAYRASGGKELVHLIFAKPEQIPEAVALAPAAVAFNFPKLTEEPHWVIDGQRIDTLKELVDYCHSLGLKICFRAVDTPESAKKSLELGIDYLPTNTLWKY